MNKHGNVRSTASKTKIKRALLVLLEEKSLEKITVRELVEKADINRSTFYAHYVDIYDLMERIEADIIDPIRSKNLYADKRLESESTTHLKQLIAYFRENQEFYRVYFSTFSENQRITEASRQMKQYFVDPCLEQTKYFEKEEFDLQFEFCKLGFFGVICKWLNNGCTASDDIVIRVLHKLFRKCLG